MKGRIAICAALLWLPGFAFAADSAAAPFGMPMEDDAVFAHFVLDQFEALLGSRHELHWEADGWLGTDEHRLVLVTEGQARGGQVTQGLHELLYAQPISPFFDVQAGVRADLDSLGHRTWAALGIAGLAPYRVELSGTLYASDGGRYAARATATYDLLLTQQLVLTPNIEVNVYSKSDPKQERASGPSDVEAGLRLRYEFSRQFAPYVGVDFQHRAAPGDTPGATTNDVRVALGVHAWL